MKTAPEALAQIKRDQAVSRAFKLAFMKNRKLTSHGNDVLGRLREFCRADMSTICEGVPPHDPIAMALFEGRRQVWLMINGYLQLDDTELANLDSQYTRMIAAATERDGNGRSTTSN